MVTGSSKRKAKHCGVRPLDPPASEAELRIDAHLAWDDKQGPTSPEFIVAKHNGHSQKVIPSKTVLTYLSGD
jgi:hypothetical protein